LSEEVTDSAAELIAAETPANVRSATIIAKARPPRPRLLDMLGPLLIDMGN